MFSAIDTAMAQASPTEMALKQISSFATEFCGEYLKEGSSSDLNLKGEAEAKLNGLLSRLAGLGVEGTAEFSADQYVGVLREELGVEIKSARECRMRIWDDLKHLVPGRTQDHGVSSSVPGSSSNKSLLTDESSDFQSLFLEDGETIFLLGGMHSLTYRKTANLRCVFSILDGKNRQHCIGGVLKVGNDDRSCDIIYLGSNNAGVTANYVLRCVNV